MHQIHYYHLVFALQPEYFTNSQFVPFVLFLVDTVCVLGNGQQQEKMTSASVSAGLVTLTNRGIIMDLLAQAQDILTLLLFVPPSLVLGRLFLSRQQLSVLTAN